MNHVFSRSLVWRHYWDQAVELSFVSFTCVEKAWMDVETFCGTTTIIGSAGANVHTSDPGRAVPYSSP